MTTHAPRRTSILTAAADVGVRLELKDRALFQDADDALRRFATALDAAPHAPAAPWEQPALAFGDDDEDDYDDMDEDDDDEDDFDEDLDEDDDDFDDDDDEDDFDDDEEEDDFEDEEEEDKDDEKDVVDDEE